MKKNSVEDWKSVKLDLMVGKSLLGICQLDREEIERQGVALVSLEISFGFFATGNF
jgi:hypothetical protein